MSNTGYYDTSYPPSLWEPKPPTLVATVPSTMVINSTTTINCTGTNFDDSTVIVVNGVEQATTVVDSTHCSCSYTAPATAGSVTVLVRTDAGDSGSRTINVTATAQQSQ